MRIESIVGGTGTFWPGLKVIEEVRGRAGTAVDVDPLELGVPVESACVPCSDLPARVGSSKIMGGDLADAREEIEDRCESTLVVLLVMTEGSELAEDVVDSCLSGD